MLLGERVRRSLASLVQALVLLGELFVEHSLDPAMNDSPKLLVRKLPLNHFPATSKIRSWRSAFVLIGHGERSVPYIGPTPRSFCLGCRDLEDGVARRSLARPRDERCSQTSRT